MEKDEKTIVSDIQVAAAHAPLSNEALTPSELNDSYYNVWRRIVLLCIAYFIRRFPERSIVLTQDSVEKPVYATQIVRALTDDDFTFSNEHLIEENESLDLSGVPTCEEIQLLLNEASNDLAYIRNAAARQNTVLAIERLGKTFDLSRKELELLMAVSVVSMDESVCRAMQYAAGVAATKKFNASLYCNVLGFSREKARDFLRLLSDRGQLIRMRLIIPERAYGYSGLLPRAFADLAVDQRVLDAICDEPLKFNLSPHMQFYELAQRPQSLRLPREFARQLKAALSEPRARIVLTGERHAGRLTATCAYARSILHKNTISVDFANELETRGESEIEAHFCDYLREALLLEAVLVMRFDDFQSGSLAEKTLDNMMAPLSRHLSFYPGVVVVTAKQMTPKLSHLLSQPVEIHIGLPSAAAQEKVWREALTGVFDDAELDRIAPSFANNYQLPVGQILDAVKHTLDQYDRRLETDPNAKLESQHILNEIRQCFSHDLESLAEVVLSEIPISRVILPETTAKTVEEILNFARFQRKVLDEWGYRQCSAYGNSLSILFAGPPGTGKTLLATAMAHELGKLLYRVDLSRIVDKYVGETEKNLAKIFDEAAKAQAILLFDEADSLFAKRTDVKSSNDRYANLEVNFLIQKLESYNGISILTTNLQASIDEAFKRRLRYIVEFRDPNAKEREKLWKSLIAPNTPLQNDIRWSILSENFELSGGHIRNATLNASIRAAANGKALGMQYLLEAAIEETKKLGKLVKLNDRILLMLDDYGVEI